MNGLLQHLREPGGSMRSTMSPIAARARPSCPGAMPTQCSDAIFWRLLVAYRPHGGLARESEVLGHFPPTGKAFAACRSAPLRFEWAGESWLPWIQFVDKTAALHPGLAAVAAELLPVFDGWDCTRWFVEPNAWLSHRRPLEMLDTEPAAVIEAARADRFVALG